MYLLSASTFTFLRLPCCHQQELTRRSKQLIVELDRALAAVYCWVREADDRDNGNSNKKRMQPIEVDNVAHSLSISFDSVVLFLAALCQPNYFLLGISFSNNKQYTRRTFYAKS